MEREAKYLGAHGRKRMRDSRDENEEGVEGRISKVGMVHIFTINKVTCIRSLNELTIFEIQLMGSAYGFRRSGWLHHIFLNPTMAMLVPAATVTYP